LDRRIALKLADDPTQRVILLASDSRANRQILGAYRGLLEARYPLGARQVSKALAQGRAPEGNAIVLL
jgi:hypothetical protein